MKAFRPQVQFGGLVPSCFVVKFRIMMICENRFHFRSYVVRARVWLHFWATHRFKSCEYLGRHEKALRNM